MKSGGSLSIWFFIGVSLAVNGAVIFATGIYELISPPDTSGRAVQPARQCLVGRYLADSWAVL